MGKMGRPFATHTRLGRLMVKRGLNCQELVMGSGTYTRILTEILAGRMRPGNNQLMKISEFLKVPPEYLLEDEYPWTPEKREAQALREEELKAEAVAQYKAEQAMQEAANQWLNTGS